MTCSDSPDECDKLVLKDTKVACRQHHPGSVLPNSGLNLDPDIKFDKQAPLLVSTQ